MKILHTADWHVGRTVRGRSRVDEHRGVLEEIVDMARLHAVDVVLVAGDLFDSAVPSPESEDVVYGALLSLADTGAQVVLVAGNHDHPDRLQAVKPLLKRAAGIHVGAHLKRPNEGGVVEVKAASGERAKIALVPFLSQRQIVRASDLMEADAGQHAQSYSRRCRRILELMCTAFDDGTVNLILAHLMVGGAEAGGGERGVHCGLDYQVPALAFPAHNVHYVALGHVHKAQGMPANVPVWYSGSPLQLDFGDSDPEKCVILVEASPGVPAVTRRLGLSAGRRLRTIYGTLEDLESQGPGESDDFLRVIVDEAPQVGLADQVRRMFPNAVEIKLAERRQEREADELVVAGDRSPRELFSEFLKEKGREDQRLLQLFEQLMEEVYEAETS